jgi:hypothetical protein
VWVCLLSFAWVPRPSVRLTLRSECFCLLFVKEPMKPYRTFPKRVGCESPFCCSSSLSPYRQNRLLHVRGSYWHPTDPAPNFLFMGGRGGWREGLWFINFYVYPVMRGFQELTRWFPESRLSLSTLHLSILQAIRTGRPKYFSYLRLLKWSLLRAINSTREMINLESETLIYPSDVICIHSF